jgi:hypothetical protein
MAFPHFCFDRRAAETVRFAHAMRLTVMPPQRLCACFGGMIRDCEEES